MEGDKHSNRSYQHGTPEPCGNVVGEGVPPALKQKQQRHRSLDWGDDIPDEANSRSNSQTEPVELERTVASEMTSSSMLLS